MTSNVMKIRSSLAATHGYERELLFELLDRPAVFGDGRVYLLGER